MVDSPVSSILPEPKPVSRTGAAASPKNPKAHAGGAGSAAAFYASEDLALRFESRDGDVLEVRRSVTVAATYSNYANNANNGRSASDCGRDADPARSGEDAAGMHGCGDGKAEGSGKAADGKGMLSEAMKWMREVSRELEKQQARLIESLLKGTGKNGEVGGNGQSGFAMYSILLVKAGVDPEAEVEGTEEDYGVPEYWNAENTSDRIVAFATSFAGIFGDDPDFAETIVNAVSEGFSQADAILGELPGKAGKLNRDTRSLVFEKLDIWLEARKSGAYNQDAQPKALEPALSA